MAQHKSSEKRIRQTAKKRLANRYKAKTTRNLVAEIRETHEQKKAEELLPKVVSNLDRLAKKNIIHWKKAANIKSKLAKKVNSLAKAK